METVTIRITDTNGRSKGAIPIGIERRSDGTVYAVHHAGEHYVASGKVGTNVRTGKPVTEYRAQGDALRFWLADDLSFGDED
ncbi:hypothetical protein G3N95_24325 [Paraburkholderia sp. Tr-20389]|uniref:hypothetical protein n=1 Tax=Paraburkholderia sp. Tr-20389 TaxID=2703903 RepID=UPI00197EEB86|nr:hypothetical protein [Paraburkholderia sp. Tr-20389]MBN3756089.1 hypothetical protein [Paraburkholderia sp. Tr-20389]